MAAALFESLLINHPFVDGNERVAVFATDVFLRMNGWRIEADPSEAYAFIVSGLEPGDLRFAGLTAWLRAVVHRTH